MVLTTPRPPLAQWRAHLLGVPAVQRCLQEIWRSLTGEEQQAVLTFLAQQPRKRHTYTDLILNAWNERERYHGVTNDSLFQVVRSLRQKIEPDPARPIYLVNWRGKPEGGYLLYPEGRPV